MNLRGFQLSQVVVCRPLTNKPGSLSASYVILFELREDTVLILSIVHVASDRAGWFDRAI